MKQSVYNKLQHLPGKTFTQMELKHILGGTEDSRFAILKRALADESLIRIRRGLYCLNPSLTREKHHPYVLADRIYGPSVISLESALSFHGLIPEGVKVVTSATPRRRHYFTTSLGDYSYSTVPSKNFMVSILRIIEGDAIYFMATPWRAIADYVYCYKKNWHNVEPLVESLRIEREELPELTREEAESLINYYHHKRVTTFLLKCIKGE